MRWIEAAAVVAMAGAGCAAIFAGVRRSLRRAVAERQASTDRQIAALATTVKALETRVTELSRLAAERAGEVPAIPTSQENASSRAREALKPEILAVITASTTAFLGKKVRIRSAKLIPAHETVNAWIQQGRMIVQTSHNLRTRE